MVIIKIKDKELFAGKGFTFRGVSYLKLKDYGGFAMTKIKNEARL